MQKPPKQADILLLHKPAAIVLIVKALLVPLQSP